MQRSVTLVVCLCAALCSCTPPSYPECSRPAYEAAKAAAQTATAAVKAGDFKKAHSVLEIAIADLGTDYGRLSFGHERDPAEPIADETDLYLSNAAWRVKAGDFKTAADLEQRVLDSRLALFKSGFQCS